MNASDLVVLGMKKRVAALNRNSGEVVWSTKLRGGSGHEFVSVLSDGKKVFATCAGWIHALDLHSGEVLWSNDLKGFGYGLGSLCLPEGGAAPGLAALQQVIAAQAAATAGAASPSH